MSPNRKLFATAAVAVGSTAALLLGGIANADPALPIDGLQAPGMPAVQSLSPAIQLAAADPTNAASMLMAAAAAFAGNSMAPQDSKNVASAVNSFVAEPAATGRARSRTGRGAGRRGSPARGRGPGPCGRAGMGSCTGSRARAAPEPPAPAPKPHPHRRRRQHRHPRQRRKSHRHPRLRRHPHRK